MSNKTKQILIPVDGSQPSVWALKLGAGLAKDLSAEITLMHVIIPPAEGVGEKILVTDDLMERLRSNELELLQAAKRQLPVGTPVRTDLREGLPAQEIVAYARRLCADFILKKPRPRALGKFCSRKYGRGGYPLVTLSCDHRVPRPESADHAQRSNRAFRAARVDTLTVESVAAIRPAPGAGLILVATNVKTLTAGPFQRKSNERFCRQMSPIPASSYVAASAQTDRRGTGHHSDFGGYIDARIARSSPSCHTAWVCHSSE